MILILFNIINLVSYEFYVVVIFKFYKVQIYGSGLDRYDPIKARVCFRIGLYQYLYFLDWDNYDQKKFSLINLSPFDSNHDRPRPD
jgi:hypothetical protein